MVGNAPFGSSTSLLEELNGQDIGMQQLNSGMSSLCFSSTMSNGGGQNADVSMSSGIPYFAHRQGESPYHPMSPAFRQQDAPPLAWHSLSSDSSSSQGAPRNNNLASPVIYSKNSFAPMMNTPVSSDGRSSLFSEGTNQLDPFVSFLPPPPNLERSDSSQHVGRLDQIGVHPSVNHIQPTSPFLSSPKRTVLMSNVASNDMETSFSSPGNYLRQPCYVPKSSPTPPSSQILYEDKPSTWNGSNDFPVKGSYREGMASSPSTYERFNSRPPRHCGTKDTQALLSPRVNLRHAASDGNFNAPFMMPLVSHTSPITDTGNGRYHYVGGSAGFSSSSFDSALQGGGQLNDRHSFGSMDTLNTNVNFQQYQISQSSPIPLDPNTSSTICQANNFVHRSPPPPILNRHNSTGTQHYLVNERGEIVGHASPMISHSLPEGFAPIEQMNNFPQNRPHRANSHGGQYAGQLNNILPQHSASLNLNFNSISFQPNDSTNSSSIGNCVGSIGDGRMQHQRHNTEPIPYPLFQQHSIGNFQPRNRAKTDSYEQDHPSVNIEVTEEVTQDVVIKVPSSALGLSEENSSESSYAAKLMAPRPQPTEDQMKGRVSSQSLKAGTSVSKSGPRMIYNIKFKRSQRNFILGQKFTREVKVGNYVKVEADRGEDLGIVMGIVPVEKFVASSKRNRSMTEGIAASGGDLTTAPPPHTATTIGDMKNITRLATNDEISLLEVNREEEEELLKICSTKVRQRGLPMSVVDAEYQFDRNKLTFFFQAEGRIDFRELVRDLFSIYKTRIWMEQIHKNGSVDDPAD